MPNAATLSRAVDTATKCLATAARPGVLALEDRARREQPSQQPGAGQPGVGQRLQRGERLGRDDEQGRGRVQVGGLLGDVGRVDVGDEAHLEPRLHERLERLVHHHRAEVGAADADVDDGLDRVPRSRRSTRRLRTLSANAYTLVSTSCTSATTSTPSTSRVVPAWLAKRGVQHRPVLGDVDVLAGEHRRPALRQVDLLGQPDQGGQHVGGDQVLRQVDVQVARR